MSHMFDTVAPEPGDVNVCSECIEISVVDEAMTLRLPTDAELYSMGANKSLIRAQMALKQFKDQRERDEARRSLKRA